MYTLQFSDKNCLFQQWVLGLYHANTAWISVTIYAKYTFIQTSANPKWPTLSLFTQKWPSVSNPQAKVHKIALNSKYTPKMFPFYSNMFVLFGCFYLSSTCIERFSNIKFWRSLSDKSKKSLEFTLIFHRRLNKYHFLARNTQFSPSLAVCNVFPSQFYGNETLPKPKCSWN